MTPAEYIQLQAFARQDGALLALLWVASFACYVLGLSSPLYGLASLLLVLLTPFFAARRLRLFRDYCRDGIISLRRGWGFVVLMFFYASLLFALVVYAYFAFMDHGFLFGAFRKMLSTPEAMQMVRQYGMEQSLADSLDQMSQMRPIDLSLNMLTTNIVVGVVLGLPIAALKKSNVKTESQK